MQKTILCPPSQSNTQEKGTEIASEEDSSPYQKAMDTWQRQPQNPYAFRSPEQTTQTTFLEGGGMQKEDPIVQKRRALQRISNHFGILFLHQLLVPHVAMLVCIFFFSLIGVTLSYSLHDSALYGSHSAILLTLILRQLFRFLIPVWIAHRCMKLPKAVTCCHRAAPAAAWLQMLGGVLCVFSGFGLLLTVCFPESRILIVILGDFSHTILCLDSHSQMVYLGFLLLCRPLFETFLYNGSMLHILRQFGESPAVFLTSLFAALFSENLITGISTFAVSYLSAKEILRYQNVWIGLVARYIYQILALLLFHSSIFREEISLPHRTGLLFLLAAIGILLLIGTTRHLPKKEKASAESKQKARQYCLQFLMQANLMTVCVFVALCFSVITLIL